MTHIVNDYTPYIDTESAKDQLARLNTYQFNKLNFPLVDNILPITCDLDIIASGTFWH